MNLTALKARLTRAKKTGNTDLIVKECNRAMEIFEQNYWPDCWSDWQLAKTEAELIRKFQR